MLGQPGTAISDGEEIWQKLIVSTSNVKLVFSGHDVRGSPVPGTAVALTSARPDGTRVHQLLANYRTCTAPACETYCGVDVHGGNGFLRILLFLPVAGTISVRTCSPYLDEFLRDASHEFVLPMN
jgi:hypothetical protein